MAMMTHKHYEQALAAREQTEIASRESGVPRGDDITDGEEPPEQDSGRMLLFDSDVVDERYESLEEAAASDLFFWFLEIDDRIDKKVRDTLDRVKDTRYWPNAFRAGGGWAGGKAQAYMEAFNDREDRNISRSCCRTAGRAIPQPTPVSSCAWNWGKTFTARTSGMSRSPNTGSASIPWRS